MSQEAFGQPAHRKYGVGRMDDERVQSIHMKPYGKDNTGEFALGSRSEDEDGIEDQHQSSEVSM